MKASIGRIVTTLNIVESNGTKEHPAIITRVFSGTDPIDAQEGEVLVNLTVFPDLMTPQVRGSIPLFHDRGDAERFLKRGHTLPVAFWPDRV